MAGVGSHYMKKLSRVLLVCALSGPSDLLQEVVIKIPLTKGFVIMSEHPAFTMAGLCAVGGVMGFAKRRSIPSLAAGLTVGALYAFGGLRIKNGGEYGYEICALASTVLLASSLPRFRAGPIPKALTATSSIALAYYGKKVYDFR